VSLLTFALVMVAAIPISAQAPVYESGDPGVTLPVPVMQPGAPYTAEAAKERIRGTVALAGVVRDDGSVTAVKVTRSLDQKFGLDDEAVKAFERWRFKPGTREGKPVAVSIAVEMSFTLK
jgi:TonB family protein